MKYMGSLYAVDDKERTIAFYKEVCGLRVIQDFGTNFTMTGGISFQTRESWSGFLEKQPSDIHYGGNDAEIYLECEDLDAFVKLLNSRTDTILLHPVKEHDWGQRGIRFYDPDMHIIEVSEPLPVVVSRFTQQGMSPSQISEKMGLSERMVNRMLDATKIQSGELLLAPAPFDFSEMTSQIILSFEQKIEKKRLDVACELDDRLMVMGDRDHLYRVVYNLVDNAVKFINEGGRLTLRAHPEGTFCAFSISNTGAGISAEDLPHVFDRFYKADRSRSMDKTGAGLGLYIVKNIINLHGGEISVRSDDGETEFSFTLPLAPPQLPGSKP